MIQETYPELPPHYTIYRIPGDVIQQQSQDLLLSDLIVTRAGYFPKATGHEVTRVTIDEYIIIYCLEGAGWFRSNGKRWQVGQGDVIIVFPDTAHAYGAANDEPWTIQWSHFRGGHASPLLRLADISLEKPIVSIGERLNLIALFNEILTTLQSGYSLHYLINASACLRQILSNIALLKVYSTPKDSRALNIETIIKFMLENLTSTCTLDDFAAHANLSISHFSHRFKEKTGYSPIDYFIRLKIQKACELLETTNMKVGEVSHYLGYKDQYYFSRVFKKITGISPTQYRLMRETKLG